jgi:hypothetical protein
MAGGGERNAAIAWAVLTDWLEDRSTIEAAGQHIAGGFGRSVIDNVLRMAAAPLFDPSTDPSRRIKSGNEDPHSLYATFLPLNLPHD